MVDRLITNLELNKANNVQVINKAASNEKGVLEFYIPNINNSGMASLRAQDNSTKINVETIVLDDTLREIKNLDFVKIDIEGAEWKLLSDKETLKGLVRHKALVLLAIHPGFNRPFKVLPLGMTFFTKTYWQLQNLLIAYNFFRRLLKIASIQRTSLDEIRSPKKCILLMFGGYFEFIVNL
jgi:FkbM family methyltransferase